MALLNSPSLLIYLELDEAAPVTYPTSSFLVALYDAPDAAQICQFTDWAAKSWISRQFTQKPKIDQSESTAACKAAAYLEDDGEFLQVRNVGAEQGFGPILYATVLELARARGRAGVIPSREPDKILDKPKRIWERFCNGSEYEGKVLTDPIPGQHPEPWLNRAYRLAPDESLLDYVGKRAEWKAYEAFWKKLHVVTGWRDCAFDMARRSVDAHVSGAHS